MSSLTVGRTVRVYENNRNGVDLLVSRPDVLFTDAISAGFTYKNNTLLSQRTPMKFVIGTPLAV